MINTEKKKKTVPIPEMIYTFDMEIHRSAGGMKITLCGAVGISEYTPEKISVKSHGTKMTVQGTKIKLNVLENKTLEIFGRVEEIRFDYGKN